MALNFKQSGQIFYPIPNTFQIYEKFGGICIIFVETVSQ